MVAQPATVIDVWLVEGVDLSDEPLEPWVADLTPAELEVAMRYQIIADQRRSILGRALARRALAQRTGGSADALVIEIDERGRPLAPETGLQFSVSHTQGLVGVAVAEVDVGLDLEWMGRKTDVDLVARRWFHPDEVADIRSCDGGARTERFFTYWTLKEAYCKALGLGLSVPLRTIRFDIAADVTLAREGVMIADWTFQVHRHLERHVVSLAAAAPAVEVHFF